MTGRPHLVLREGMVQASWRSFLIKCMASASNGGVCLCVYVPCRGRQANIQCLYLCVYVCIWGGGRGTCREQLYAQIQADAAMKKAQEEVCGV